MVKLRICCRMSSKSVDGGKAGRMFLLSAGRTHTKKQAGQDPLSLILSARTDRHHFAVYSVCLYSQRENEKRGALVSISDTAVKPIPIGVDMFSAVLSLIYSSMLVLQVCTRVSSRTLGWNGKYRGCIVVVVVVVVMLLS